MSGMFNVKGPEKQLCNLLARILLVIRHNLDVIIWHNGWHLLL